MRKIDYYSNILKKGTIIFNCATSVNYCSDHKTWKYMNYDELSKEYKELFAINCAIRSWSISDE